MSLNLPGHVVRDDASGHTAEGNGDTAQRTCHLLWGTVYEALEGGDVTQKPSRSAVARMTPAVFPLGAHSGSSSLCSQPLDAHC